MNKFIILLILITSQTYAAQESVMLQFNWIKPFNKEHAPMKIEHTLHLHTHERHTKKTFKELYNNAQNHNIPWLLACELTLLKTLYFDYIDILSLLKTEGIVAQPENFACHSAAETFLKQVVARHVEETYYTEESTTGLTSLRTLYPSFSSLGSPISRQGPILVNVYHHGHTYMLSDLSCTLAILYKDYRQLVPFIIALKSSNAPAAILDFWHNKYKALPYEMRIALPKEYPYASITQQKEED